MTTTNKLTWSVTENSGGILTLYIFDGDGVIYSRSGYENNPDQLRSDLTKLSEGANPTADGWDNCDPDPQRSWDQYCADDYCTIICDQDGPIPVEQMGESGKLAFTSPGENERKSEYWANKIEQDFNKNIYAFDDPEELHITILPLATLCEQFINDNGTQYYTDSHKLCSRRYGYSGGPETEKTIDVYSCAEEAQYKLLELLYDDLINTNAPVFEYSLADAIQCILDNTDGKTASDITIENKKYFER